MTLPIQRSRRLSSRLGEDFRCAHVTFARCREPLLQFRFADRTGFELSEFRCERLAQGRQLARFDAVLARDGFERRQSRLDPFLPRRIGIERVGVMTQARQRLARGNRCLLELRGRRLERGIEADELPQHTLRTRQGRRDAAVVAGQQGLDLCGAFGQAAEAGDALAFLDHRFGFARLGIERLQFGDEMTQQVEPRFAVARTLLEGGALFVERLPGRMRRAHGCVLRGQLAAAVERLALVTAARQRLELELAVHVDQQFAECAQRLHRHRLAVQVGAAAAIGADDSSQLALAVVLDRLFIEPGQRGRVAGQRERRADLGPLRAVPHRPAVRATADGQQQRVDQDRLAGAGFAREHGEAAVELEFDRLDDGEVANLQVRQHSGVPAGQAPGGCPSRVPRPQCSLERRMR